MPRAILENLKKIQSATVLCLGDLMLDRYIYGQASRLSPEAPVPIVTVKRKTFMPGGLGNVVMNLHSLGAKPLAVGVVGTDQSAQILSDLFSKILGAQAAHLIKSAQRPTTVKTRVIAGIQQVVRFDEEWEMPLTEDLATNYQKAVSPLLARSGAVAASDYGKGVLSRSFCAWLMEKASQDNLAVVVDPKGADYGRYRGATLVTPNRQELALATSEDLNGAGQEKLIEVGRKLMEKNDLKNLLITLSEDGMTLLTCQGQNLHFPAKAREVFDVSGAGDTVVAAMTACLAAGLDLAAGAELATLAAAVVVGKVGTATASPNEIIDSLSSPSQ
ncbi:MAG: D-glycero-beta-D-manno-heptose-7-phosphate kinase [Deltaproteobacteria bacterium]|jgi:D-beta-D-heptose 7-phosphate kinase/D-beta-D-heptose 1-phosphate adenosyltransferase|nr:D-glycero-beta-D-manno-heptose-7-phosphate kinase [Deltaproteobacteria bacterium]